MIRGSETCESLSVGSSSLEIKSINALEWVAHRGMKKLDRNTHSGCWVGILLKKWDVGNVENRIHTRHDVNRHLPWLKTTKLNVCQRKCPMRIFASSVFFCGQATNDWEQTQQKVAIAKMWQQFRPRHRMKSWKVEATSKDRAIASRFLEGTGAVSMIAQNAPF